MKDQEAVIAEGVSSSKRQHMSYDSYTLYMMYYILHFILDLPSCKRHVSPNILFNLEKVNCANSSLYLWEVFSGNLLVENLWKKVFGVYTHKQGILELRS